MPSHSGIEPSSTHEEVDVLVVGAGPTGALTSLLLSTTGKRVVMIDKLSRPNDEPRAISIDDDGLRILYIAGVAEKVLSNSLVSTGLVYVGADFKEFARVSPTQYRPRLPKRSAIHQPDLVNALLETANRASNFSTIWNCELTDACETHGGVEAHTTDADGCKKSFMARYLIACDAGALRRRLGSELTGKKFVERWLVLDFVENPSAQHDTIVFCNPTRPAITLAGPNHRRRWEFMLHKNDAEDEIPADAKQIMLRFGDGDPGRLIRKAAYTFRSQLAHDWRRGRIIFAGDAVRRMPPFAGQGMNSGLRDAVNLCWKVNSAISGLLDERILESYKVERYKHSLAMIRFTFLVGNIMRPKTALRAKLTQMLLRQLRQIEFISNYILEMKYKPNSDLRRGWLLRTQFGTPSWGGKLLPDATYFSETTPQRTVRLVQIVPKGFVLLSIGAQMALEAERISATYPLNAFNPVVFSLESAKLIDDDLFTIDENEKKSIFPAYAIMLVRPDQVVALADNNVNRFEDRLGRLLAVGPTSVPAHDSIIVMSVAKVIRGTMVRGYRTLEGFTKKIFSTST